MEAEDHSSTVVLNVGRLQKGMYVSYLDRPWVETKFPFRGFEIKTDAELEQLRATCEYVFIKTEQGVRPDGYQKFMESRSDTGEHAIPDLAKWDVSVPTEDEFGPAKAAIADFRKAIIGLFTAANRKELLDIDPLFAASAPLLRSLERCPDAALYTIRTSDGGDYLYRHAVACGVMGMIMGRALGLTRDMLEDIAAGCALLDIGKTRVPQELLNRPSSITLTSGELAQLRKHVEHGLKIVGKSKGSNRHVSKLISTHHERYDGRGYPDGLEGEAIPLSGRIAGMVDLYDAMISLRTYGRRATPNEAIRYIRQQRGKDFCPQLTDQFVQVFRLYPTGSLVELSDGSVGRVIQQHPKALVTPRVQLILDANKVRLHEYRTVELKAAADGKETLCILKPLKPGSYGIEC